MTIGEKLLGLKARSGLTLTDIASLANYRGRSSVQKFFASDYDPPVLDSLVAQRLARALVGRGSPPIVEGDIFSLSHFHSEHPGEYQFATIENVKRDVAVYVCASAGKIALAGNSPVESYVVELDDPISYVWHPPGLSNNVIFGLDVHGVILYPRYRPGEYIFIDETSPARLGDDVCIKFKGIKELSNDKTTMDFRMFGTLERQNSSSYFFRTIDEEGTFSLKVNDVEKLQRLISVHDALRR